MAEVHRRWFRTTFPNVAGYVRRQEEVRNRKATAWPARSVEGGVREACLDWEAATAAHRPESRIEGMLFSVQQANRVAVRVYDIHPFLDGNTRATWSLRNYALLRTGLGALAGLGDRRRYARAWWQAAPDDHAFLDEVVAEELVAMETRREAHNRRA